MTHILRLVQGSTTIDFSGAGYLLVDYTPSAPEPLAVENALSVKDGGTVSNIRYQNVTESAIIYLESGVQDKLNSIEEFFDNIKTYTNRRIGEKSYITYRPTGDSTHYRSEILMGNVSLSGNAMTYYANDSAEVLVTFTRRYYWEGDETAIPLNNPNGSKTTAGIAVDNDLDGSNYNYVDIVGTDVPGVIPSPIKIELERTDVEDGTSTAGFYFSNNVFGVPFSYSPVYQGEDASNVDVVSSSFGSGGQGGKFDTAAGPSNQRAHTWTITKAEAERMKGRPHRMIASMLLTFSGNRTVQGRNYKPLDGAASTLLGKGPEVIYNGVGLLDLGTMRFPQTLLGDTQGSFEYQLWTRANEGSGTASLIVDYVMLLPADSFMKIVGAQYDTGDKVIVDGIDEQLYMERSTDRYNIYRLESEYLTIFPNRDQRIHLLNDHTTTDFINIKHTVKAWYRPRRLTI